MSPKVPKIVLAHTQFKGFMPGKIHSMDNKFKERDIAPALKVTFVGPTLGLPGALNGTVRATYMGPINVAVLIDPPLLLLGESRHH